MLRLITMAVLVSQGAESFFLATSGPQASLLRGHVQGLWPGGGVADKYQYNARLEYQAPGFQHFTDHHAFYEQGSSNLHPNILPPPPPRDEPERQNEPLEQSPVHQQITPQLYQVPQLPSREPLFSDPQTSQLYSSNLIQQGRMPFLSTYGVPHSMALAPTVENLQAPGGTTETTIPIVVKLDNNQAVVVPVKAVYALPPFLENLIQRIQAYYSVYNPVESFHLERPYGPPQVPSGLYESIPQLPSNDVSQDLKEPTTTPVSTTSASVASSPSTSTSSESSTEQEATSSEQTTPDATTIAPPSPSSSSSEETSEDKSSELNEIASSTTTEAALVETTTTPAPSSSTTSSEAPSQENVSPDLENEGYTYNRPSRAFLFG